MTEQTECPICYDKIDDNINVSISSCNHKFHTNCLLLCGPKCPLCRANLVQHKFTNIIYLPPNTPNVCEKTAELEAEMDRLMKASEKNDPIQYKLFCGSI